MDKEIELLLLQKETLINKLTPIVTEMDLIDKRIYEIRNSCLHENIETIEAYKNNHHYTIDKCKNCGESWLS